ncbi:MAG: hypothetical protein AAF830_05155 [Pseudomonadota bacterium]
MRLKTMLLCAVLAACGGEGTAPETEAETETSDDIAASTDDGVLFVFATPEEGGDVLAAQDEYTAELQKREIGIRARDAAVTRFGDLAPLYRQDTLPWTDEEKDALRDAINTLLPTVSSIDQHLPERVLLVKTGEIVEGGLPHTRANAIIFAGGGIPSGGPLKALFLHELHHVMTRANPQMADEYYRIVGFEPCRFAEPVALRKNRLSNPDAATYKHFAPVGRDDAEGVIPYLYANRDYDGEGRLPAYFGFGLLPVDVEDGVCTSKTAGPDGLLAPDAVPEFAALIGSNTGYIIHPEEVLADNFVFWAMERGDLPNPEIPDAVGAFWLGE